MPKSFNQALKSLSTRAALYRYVSERDQGDIGMNLRWACLRNGVLLRVEMRVSKWGCNCLSDGDGGQHQCSILGQHIGLRFLLVSSLMSVFVSVGWIRSAQAQELNVRRLDGLIIM